VARPARSVSPLPDVAAKTESSRRAPAWPLGHVAGSPDADMGLRSSNTTSQAVQRNS
jgi:hypothetical protein